MRKNHALKRLYDSLLKIGGVLDDREGTNSADERFSSEVGIVFESDNLVTEAARIDLISCSMRVGKSERIDDE
jgi:hypothetical protein